MNSLWADENPFPAWERRSLEPVVENGTRSQYRETEYLVKWWGHCVPVHTSRRVAVGSTVVGSLPLAVMFDAFASWELATEIISFIIPLSPHFSFTHPTPHPPTPPAPPRPPPGLLSESYSQPLFLSKKKKEDNLNRLEHNPILEIAKITFPSPHYCPFFIKTISFFRQKNIRKILLIFGRILHDYIYIYQLRSYLSSKIPT
jgi:hypothetical protein